MSNSRLLSCTFYCLKKNRLLFFIILLPSCATLLFFLFGGIKSLVLSIYGDERITIGYAFYLQSTFQLYLLLVSPFLIVLSEFGEKRFLFSLPFSRISIYNAKIVILLMIIFTEFFIFYILYTLMALIHKDIQMPYIIGYLMLLYSTFSFLLFAHTVRQFITSPPLFIFVYFALFCLFIIISSRPNNISNCALLSHGVILSGQIMSNNLILHYSIVLPIWISISYCLGFIRYRRYDSE